jgi:hypothetical protein
MMRAIRQKALNPHMRGALPLPPMARAGTRPFSASAEWRSRRVAGVLAHALVTTTEQQQPRTASSDSLTSSAMLVPTQFAWPGGGATVELWGAWDSVLPGASAALGRCYPDSGLTWYAFSH